MSAFRAAPERPRCSICRAPRPFGCRQWGKIRHRLSPCPIDGFRLSDMDVGDLLIREPNGTWSLERVPEVAADWWGEVS